MGKQTKHSHPNPLQYRVQQISAMMLFACAIGSALLLLIIGAFLSAPLFIPMSILVVMLSLYLLMAIVNTPPIIIDDEGIRLQPQFGSERMILWDEITHVEPYPLLPQPNQEVLKQYMIGRKKYRPADGIMLSVPSLPVPYRIAGVLAGANGQPIIALTNRTHTDYERLVERITRLADHALDDSLTTKE